MNAIIQVLRWLLVPVSGAAVVALCVLAARWSIHVVDRQCSPESMVAGSCVEPWHTTAVETAIYLAAAFAALGLVVLPAVTAPRFQQAVATVGFLLAAGAGGAVYFLTAWSDMLAPAAIAILAGAFGFWWVWSRKHPDDS